MSSRLFFFPLSFSSMWLGCVKVKKLVSLVARTALMVRKMGWINGEE
jgi:hypothetical protein